MAKRALVFWKGNNKNKRVLRGLLFCSPAEVPWGRVLEGRAELLILERSSCLEVQTAAHTLGETRGVLESVLQKNKPSFF